MTAFCTLTYPRFMIGDLDPISDVSTLESFMRYFIEDGDTVGDIFLNG